MLQHVQTAAMAVDDIVHLDAQDARSRRVVDAHAAVVVHGHGRGLDVLQYGAGKLLDDAPSLQGVCAVGRGIAVRRRPPPSDAIDTQRGCL